MLQTASAELGLVSRVIATARGVPALFRTIPRNSHVYVLGLGEVHLLVTAILLSFGGRYVTFDTCDSWVLQARARRGAATRVRSFVPTIGAVVQRVSPRRLGVSYISLRDMNADRSLIGRRQTVVIPPALPAELIALPALGEGPLDRIVVAVDLTTFHNQRGFADLIRAWKMVGDQIPSLRLEIYGRGVNELDIDRAVVRGWAPTIASVYEGRTAVFVTNSAGSGVPNKVVEAVAARRPMIVSDQLSGLVAPGPWVFTYRHHTDLAELLLRLATMRFDTTGDVPELMTNG